MLRPGGLVNLVPFRVAVTVKERRTSAAEVAKIPQNISVAVELTSMAGVATLRVFRVPAPAAGIPKCVFGVC